MNATLEPFTRAEFATRLARLQNAMGPTRLDAVVVTTPANVRYFSGFASEFWQSPTRPWYLVLPAAGEPVAVIPAIGAPGWAETWVGDIRTWPAPVPDDDGVSLVADALARLPAKHGRIGWEMGREMAIRAPLIDLHRIAAACRREFVDAAPAIWSVRMIKSPGEIARIARACEIAGDAFSALIDTLRAGDSEADAARKMRLELIARGADNVPFIAACSGPGGYDQIIVGSRPRRLSPGDVLFIDTGATVDGYFCDFDRNYAIGEPSDAVRDAHEKLWQATEAGIAACRPGARASDLARVMAAALGLAGGDDINVGRLGHGLGLQLTEPPSNMAGDDTELAPGMVMTIEPGLEFAPGRMLVHEENVVVTEDGCRLLSPRAPRQMPVIAAPA